MLSYLQIKTSFNTRIVWKRIAITGFNCTLHSLTYICSIYSQMSIVYTAGEDTPSSLLNSPPEHPSPHSSPPSLPPSVSRECLSQVRIKTSFLRRRDLPPNPLLSPPLRKSQRGHIWCMEIFSRPSGNTAFKEEGVGVNAIVNLSCAGGSVMIGQEM